MGNRSGIKHCVAGLEYARRDSSSCKFMRPVVLTESFPLKRLCVVCNVVGFHVIAWVFIQTLLFFAENVAAFDQNHKALSVSAGEDKIEQRKN